MASMVLIAPSPPPTSYQSLTLSSRFSFSKSQTLANSLSSSSTVSLSLSTVTSPTLPSVYCGRGDRKTARGKRFNHSFGNARPRDKNKGRGPPKVPVTPAPPKKDKFEDDTIVKIEIDESLSSN
ncbi:30S ribosomal protein S31, chloroplastic [Quercus robur]|uniref:30S ribosomal protein S31, chloroplastic n=1 Tax=Quercus robur TaxID=38942 RepID=UPI0021634290|nr:30S ribosomal protein S31, chloroplastic [Quercus robur]